MTDTTQKIAEIREALEDIKHYDLNTLDNIMMPVYNFCVNAPEWLRFLLDEREKMIEWIKSALVGAMKESCRHETPDPTWHCCDWAELVEKAREIGVMVE